MLPVLFPLLALAAVAEPAAADVVVYGGSSGGVAAAVQVARLGKSVVLIEPGKHLGGLTTGGLGATDIGNKAAIGGLSRDFYRAVRAHYDDESNWTREKRAAFKGRGHEAGEDTGWTFEPHVADRIFADWVKRHNISVVFGERLDLTNGVRKDGAKIVSLATESGKTFRGRVFIDATYEGDLLAKAGVGYHVGREANATYGETLNGVQVKNSTKHQFVKDVDPYVKPGDPSSGLLPNVVAGPPAPDGTGDNKPQAYNFRLCATDAPENRRPWPKPANYDEKNYELLLRNFEAGDHRLPWNPVLMPNRKTDSNNNFAFSTDYIGKNYDYPEGDYVVRERIWNDHVEYQKGLMWTLANHPRVPPKVREHFTKWGLSRDEFLDTDNWPNQLYVREARRMVGAYVMAEQNCRGSRTVEDSVGLAAYTMDSHNIQRYVTKEGFVRNEGDVQVGGFPPYPISYQSLTPKESECSNLLVPVCLSASHIAYGSIRMEPVFMVLGQSAATAAAMAIDADGTVQAVPYPALRAKLLAEKQILDWKPGARKGAGGAGIDAKTLPGVVVDDEAAERNGFEETSSSIHPFVAAGYRHSGGVSGRAQTARFRPELPEAGRYEVRVWYGAHPNRASKVPVTVAFRGGSSSAVIDQRKPAPAGGLAVGTFAFEAGKAGYVEIGTAGADGHVIIDAVQWVKK